MEFIVSHWWLWLINSIIIFVVSTIIFVCLAKKIESTEDEVEGQKLSNKMLINAIISTILLAPNGYLLYIAIIRIAAKQ